MSSYDTWSSPLSGRYSSDEMLKLFSPRTRATTWRKLWLYLAKAQKELGLDISDKAIAQMEEHLVMTDRDFEIAAEEEKIRLHDVMGHVHAYGVAAPEAAGIIHLGATSCYVTDNADLMLMRDALQLLLPKLAAVIKKLSNFAQEWKHLPCLGYTHGQPAQITTVGKRACSWIQDLLMDLHNLTHALSLIRFRGTKGTTGTEASFMALYASSHAKVKKQNDLVTHHAGFQSSYPISTQTYPRKLDVDIAHALASFGSTCKKIGGDIRHLAMTKELEEPFERTQTGSSAMAYKRNPMRSERLCSLGEYLKNLSLDASGTYAAQWLERSLDDSACRRLYIPEMFLTSDACLKLLNNISSGLVVYPAIIQRRIDAELPFMATENIIMALVQKGESRQEAHEQIRTLSHEAAAEVKLHGRDNDLIERIRRAPFFADVVDELQELLRPEGFVGRAPEQVEEFLGVGGEVEVALAGFGGLDVEGVETLKV